eukprot:224631-Amphidinium_carterae.1
MDPAGRSTRKIEVDADEDELEKAVNELAEQRKMWGVETTPESAHFATHLRGGRWSMAVLGQAIERFVSAALTNEAKEFCKREGLALTASFSVSRYGASDGAQLAKLWTNHMELLFLTMTDTDGVDERTVLVELGNAAVDESLAVWYEGLAATGVSRKRAEEILSISVSASRSKLAVRALR